MTKNMAKLHWATGAIDLNHVAGSPEQYLDRHGIYAIVAWGEAGVRELLYIGQASSQTLRERILQEHASIERCIREFLEKNRNLKLVVKLGVPVSGTPESWLDDIECCLIHTNQPLCNTACKQSYSGRPVHITNQGDFLPLNQESDCSPDLATPPART